MTYIKRYNDINEKNFMKKWNDKFEDYLNGLNSTNDGNNTKKNNKSINMSDLFISVLLKISNNKDIEHIQYSEMNPLILLLFKLYKGEIDKEYIKTTNHQDYLSFNDIGQITYLDKNLFDENKNNYINSNRQVSSSLLKTLRTILTDNYIKENSQIQKTEKVVKSFLKKKELISLKKINKDKNNDTDTDKINKLIDIENIIINEYNKINNKQPLINKHFELFSNGVKVIFKKSPYKIKILSGNDIEPTFDNKNLTKDCEYKSCLSRHVDDISGYFDLYKTNKETRSLIIYDDTKTSNYILGRRMIFTGKQIGNHGIFKDGVEYTVANLFYGTAGRGGIIDLYLKKWCKKNNILLIGDLKEGIDKFRIKITDANVKQFPPMDDICYINPYDNEISNYNFGKMENNDHWFYIRTQKPNNDYRHIKRINENIDVKNWERFFEKNNSKNEYI